MAELLKRIFITHTTSRTENANTRAKFELTASTSGTDFQEEFKDLPHNERERGLTDYYEFDVTGRGVESDTELTIAMITTDDGWLPSSIWAMGETTSGKSVLLAANPNWTKWFDRGSGSVGEEKYKIN